MSEEEIDIIELLKRVKEGKAPKRIKWVDTDTIFEYNPKWQNISDMYRKEDDNEYLMAIELATLIKEIKILDKPIIEEIPLIEIKHDYSNGKTTDTYEVERAITNEELAKKINEIIKHINKEEK